uniref:BSD domain-containing protein n=1 Tax=Caenorhabditis tropicalis TaxID=1561998 RepID=A0A1I7UD09_9PELO
MSVTSFLRRFSIDVENVSSSSSAPGSASSSGPTKRRGRIAASIDSARRRFSLQHGTGNGSGQDPVHLQSIALRGRGKGENGSLPDLIELPEKLSKSFWDFCRLIISNDPSSLYGPATLTTIKLY